MAGIKISDLPPVVIPALTDVFPIDQGAVTYKEDLSQVLSLFKTNGEALTRINDTNVTVTLGGSPSIALFNATSLTMGWAGQLAVPRGGTGNSTFTPYSVICAGTTATGAFQNVSGVGASGEVLTSNGAGALPTWQANASGTVTSISAGTGITLTPNPITTTGSVALTVPVTEVLGGTNQTTYTLGDTLYASAANTLSKLAGNTTTAKQYLSQTGNGAISAAPAWATIDGGDITGAALTRVDDTNVTLTLGGTPTTALLRATSITAGWAGQLSLARGGTNANLTASNGGIFYSTATAGAILAGTATAGQILRSGASAAPSWSTATYPATAGTSGNVLTSDGTNWSSAAPAASATSVIADDTTTNATMYPVWVTANTGSLPLKVTSTKLNYNPSTSLLTNIGPIGQATKLQSSAGVTLLGLNYTASAVNFLNLYNNTTGNAPQLGAAGTDSNVGIVLSPKADAFVEIVDSTGAFPGKLAFSNANNTKHTFLTVASAQATDVTFTLPAADGTSGQVMTTNGSGVLSLASTKCVQQVYQITATKSTGTTQSPMDDTIPQNTEGDQYLTVSITPKSATNILKFEVLCHFAHSAGTAMTIAIFQDSNANAIVAGSFWMSAINTLSQGKVIHEVAAGTTSSTTFNVRVGCTNVGTTTFNGAANARYLGGVLASGIVVTEYTP